MRVTIDFDPVAKPITGSLVVEDGAQQEFEGMIELLSLLEAARDEAQGNGLSR